MSIHVMDIVWKFSRNKGSALLLELAIADHAHDDGTGAWPSISTLAHKIRMTERATQKILRKLEQSKEVTTRVGEGPHSCNAYHVEIKRIQKRARGEKFSPPNVQHPGVNAVHQKFTGGVNKTRSASGERADTRTGTVTEPSGTVKKPSSSRARAKTDDVDGLKKQPGIAAHLAQIMVDELGIDHTVAFDLAQLSHVNDSYLQEWVDFDARDLQRKIATQQDYKVLGPGFYVDRIKRGLYPQAFGSAR